LKTQIITLETHDDLISVRDKLSWAKTPRVLLVWPRYEEISLRILDLKVLQRHTNSLGAQLGLVTRRANVRRDAESLGIPVFDSTASAQKDLWPDPAPRMRRIPRAPRRDLRRVRAEVYEKEASWRQSLPGRVLIFTFGVLAILAISVLWIPRAELVLYPESINQSVIIPVSASEAIDSVSITGSVPDRKASIIVSAEQSLAIVNEISVPRSKAQGIARFSNLSQKEVTIPAGTVVSTNTDPPVSFVTLHETLLPPGVDEFVDIPVEAVHPGAAGNVAADSIAVLDGQLGLLVTVTNPNLMKGGTESKVTGATDSDRAKLRAVVEDNLRREAEAKLKAQISPGDLFLSDSFELIQVLEESYDPTAGKPGKQLKLNMQIEFSARYISAEDLNQLSLAALDASVPLEFKPYGVPLFKPLAEPLTDTSGVTHFDLEITRTLLRRIDSMQVFSLVRGREPLQVKDELTTDLSLRKDPQIFLSPRWWPWMPLIPFNISMVIK